MINENRKSRGRKVSRISSSGEFVIKALGNNKYDYRTAEGIARETNIPVNKVMVILNDDKRVRTSIIKRKDGKKIYTLKSKKSAVGDVFTAFRAMSSDKMGD